MSVEEGAEVKADDAQMSVMLPEARISIGRVSILSPSFHLLLLAFLAFI
ncbi:MAG: hypothetical protein N2V76_06175 [Methanophagales archaeon]|nr:hypothetical protein [Methanophagales archaeon]